MRNLRKHLKHLWQDESAQGTSEYILLLVVVLAVAFVFKNKILEVVRGKMEELGGDVMGFGRGDKGGG